MKEASSSSPFAALSSKEQLERWACWHSQRMQEEPTDEKTEPESVVTKAEQTDSRHSFRPHHSQYDAVVRRMQLACQRTKHYMDTSSE